MPNYAILDSTTRVVMRLTTEDPPAMNAGEIAIEVAKDFDIAPPEGKNGRGWLKLDDKGEKVEATAEERALAITPKPSPRAQAIIDAGNAVVANAKTPADVKVLAQALIDLMTPPTPAE